MPRVLRTLKLVEILFSDVFNIFLLFKTFFSEFPSEIKKKCLKKLCFKPLEMAKESILTSFHVNTATKSWSKYTTLMYSCKKSGHRGPWGQGGGNSKDSEKKLSTVLESREHRPFISRAHPAFKR